MGRIVVDTSAIIAILKKEATAVAVEQAINIAEFREISTASLVEAASALIADQLNDPENAVEILETLVRRLRIEITPFDEIQARAAMQARVRFGKGRHRARLNLGDCFAYALAKTRKAPLLFVGDDFTHTDLEAALV